MAYATREDLYRYGLPRGLLANPGRLVGAIYTASDTVELESHGFETDTALVFRAEEGGSMPSPLVAGTTYYAIRVSDSQFKVATTAGGSAVNLSTDGESVVVSTSLDATLDAELERYSRLVDSYLPAHQVPLTDPVPVVIVGCVAKLAAASLLEIMGQSSALVQASAEQTRKELARLVKGIPLRDANATASANLAVSGRVLASRGWTPSDGSIP